MAAMVEFTATVRSAFEGANAALAKSAGLEAPLAATNALTMALVMGFTLATAMPPEAAWVIERSTKEPLVTTTTQGPTPFETKTV